METLTMKLCLISAYIHSLAISKLNIFTASPCDSTLESFLNSCSQLNVTHSAVALNFIFLLKLPAKHLQQKSCKIRGQLFYFLECVFNMTMELGIQCV